MKRMAAMAVLSAAGFASIAHGAEVVPIFPGPDVPVFVTDKEYAIGWWTEPGISDLRIDLYYGGVYEKTLVNSTPNDGKWIWKVPASQHLNSDYRLRMSDAAHPANYHDSSEFGVGATANGYGYFQITKPFNDQAHTIAVQGHPFEVSWESALTSGSVDVQLWYLNHVESTLAKGIPDTGRFVWNVPSNQHLNGDYRIIVRDSMNVRLKGATTEFGVAPVPEPATLGLLLAGGLMMRSRRGRTLRH